MQKSKMKKVIILSIVFLIIFSSANAGSLPSFMSFDVSNIIISRNYYGVNQIIDYGDAVKLCLKLLTKSDGIKSLAVASIIAPHIDEKYYVRLDRARTGLLIAGNDEMLNIPNKKFQNYFSLLFEDEELVSDVPQDISAARLIGFLKMIDSEFFPSLVEHFNVKYAAELVKVIIPRLKSTRNEDVMVGEVLLPTSVQRYELSSRDTKKLATAIFNAYKEDESLKKVLLSLIWTDEMDTDNQYSYIKNLLLNDINFTIKTVSTWLFEGELVKLSINGYKEGNKKNTYDLEIANDSEVGYYDYSYRCFEDGQEIKQTASFAPIAIFEGIEAYALTYEKQQYIDGNWKIMNFSEAVFEHDTRTNTDGVSYIHVNIKVRVDNAPTYDFRLNYAYNLEESKGNLEIFAGTKEDNIGFNLDLIISTSDSDEEYLIGEVPDFYITDAYELTDDELSEKGNELLKHFVEVFNNLKRLPLIPKLF